jgi:hypothetical protein
MANGNGNGIVRGASGRFDVGCKPGPGRPTKAMEKREVVQVAEIRAKIRKELLKRGLIDRALSMAQGAGPYKKLGLHFQHAIFMDLLGLCVPKPAQIQIANINATGEEGVELIKRVIWVMEVDV